MDNKISKCEKLATGLKKKARYKHMEKLKKKRNHKSASLDVRGMF